MNLRQLTAVMCLVAGCLIATSYAVAQTVRTLAVSGHAKQQFTPDAFNMDFTFEERGHDLVIIKNAVDARINKASKMLIDNDVNENNIRSMDVTLYPWIETQTSMGNQQREQVNKGFVYRRTLYFTHDNIEAFDALIKKIATLSPSSIGQFSLINQNLDTLKRALTKAALNNAREKAIDMADEMGMEVGHVLFMSDGTKPPEHMFERNGRMLMSQAADAPASLPGQNTIESTVEVVFEVHTLSRKQQN
ncbi:SIMPL domain-containing protein [Glaciecola siphonariae]|uniref:SIMPL domain-containing protein n=1 Tax=Glaciecola siphonariae TaxID=521012 RepID=A0ABV9LT74_9ALTE